MRKRIGPQLRQRRDGGGADKTVKHNRNALPPRRERRAQYGGEFAPAERRGRCERFAQYGRIPRQRIIDRLALARETFFVDAGAAAGPARAAVAK
jgi:hypothetical protein